MAHNEHNAQRKGRAFFLIFLGAILLMIAPTQYPNSHELGSIALVSGLIIGGIGFYKYAKSRKVSI